MSVEYSIGQILVAVGKKKKASFLPLRVYNVTFVSILISLSLEDQ